jgi:hypothetical protein
MTDDTNQTTQTTQSGQTSGTQGTTQTTQTTQTVAGQDGSGAGNQQTQQNTQNTDTKTQAPYWPEDWRQKAAERVGGTNQKAVEKELRRLESIADPADVYSSYRAIENTWASRNFVKMPGKDAKPEELAEFHKALGVPETPADYFKDIKLSNGAVIGEADKPMVDAFAAAVHKAGATPAAVSAAMDWYFSTQEQRMADIDGRDATQKDETLQDLKTEYGASFNRYRQNATAALFAFAPGGLATDDPASLMSRLLTGRTSDGVIIGNDPQINRWLIALGLDKNPSGAVVDDGDQTGKTVENEISEIEKKMREDRRGYFKDLPMQSRYKELLTARESQQARKRA